MEIPSAPLASSPIARGADVIRSYLKHAPKGPGVYRMLGEDGTVLYVGKAKNIQRRITSYTRPEGHTVRILRMIAQTASMIFVSTKTEMEALLLEANYIKQMKPRFNVLLRDDKSFPYILLTGDHKAPQMLKHRGARNRKGDYFGPFASPHAVDQTLEVLQRAFLLRTCTDSYYQNRTRPCLLWQIKRCAAPCTSEISLEDYQILVQEARDFLCGKSRLVREQLAQEMTQASKALEYEKAARLRDRIAVLSSIQSQQGINPKTFEEADVFALVEEAGHMCVEAVFFRAYQNWGNKAYFPHADKEMEAGEVLESFLSQFYADRPCASLILISHEIKDGDVLREALAERMGHKIEIVVPKRGEKRDFVEHAIRNARAALGRKLAEAMGQAHLLQALAHTFGFERPIRRIEIYDNSHLMGQQAIGAMVVAGPSGLMKAHYRTFSMKNEALTPGDDYAMMREMLTRRLRHVKKEGQEVLDQDLDVFPESPDLLLIDGGKGQYEVAKNVLEAYNLSGSIYLLAIAKGEDREAGRETFFMEGRSPFQLPPKDPTLYFMQRLRDEAHRFAIGNHRARRKKQMTKSPLDEISGIGPSRKRILLQAFGTAKAVADASLTDLEKTKGIQKDMAKRIYDFFHPHVGD